LIFWATAQLAITPTYVDASFDIVYDLLLLLLSFSLICSEISTATRSKRTHKSHEVGV